MIFRADSVGYLPCLGHPQTNANLARRDDVAARNDALSAAVGMDTAERLHNHLPL